MTARDRRRRPRPEQAADPALADRLERALTPQQVERVLARAVELQLDDEIRPAPLDEAALERIGRELGISVEHVRRALAEERTLGSGQSRTGVWDRLLAPDKVVESAVVAGSRTEVESRVGHWMQGEEGMRVRSTGAGTTEWERDDHVLTRLRMGLRLGHGSPAMRTARGVAHRLESIEPERQLVALEAGTGFLKRLGGYLLGLGAVGAAAGAAAGAVAGQPEAPIIAAGAFAVGGSAVVLGIRMWADRIRGALRRALDGITRTAAGGPDRLGYLRRDWRRLRRGGR